MSNYPSTYSILSDLAPKGAFGDNISLSLTPIKQLTAQYGLVGKSNVFSATGGSATTENSLFKLQTGTSIGGYGVIQTNNPIVYRAGQGIVFRGTAAFTTGVPLSLQAVGLFQVIDGLFFGYDGANFGIARRYGGFTEIRTIQVTGAASGSENLTLTLNGTAYTIPLTSGTVAKNVYEIAEYLIANASTAWNVDQVGDTVTITARGVDPRSGTYSFSSSSATGTITQVKAGVSHSYEWIYQDDWERNKLSGLDPTKLNAYQIRMPFLGTANVFFDVYDNNTSKWVNVHQIKRANQFTEPLVGNPSFFGGWISESLGSTTNLTVTGASIGMFIEGESKLTAGSKESSNTNTSVSSTPLNLLTVKCRWEIGDRPNIGFILPERLSIASTSSKATRVNIIINADIGQYNYTYQSENESLALIDKSGGNVTNGTVIAGLVLGPSGSQIVDLSGLGNVINPGDTITIAANVVSGASSEVSVSFIWKESL